MSGTEIFITIAVVILATALTRFLPYIIFPEGKKVPTYVNYLGKYLAPAVFGLLVVYCLRHVDITTSFAEGGTHGLPELIAIIVVTVSFIIKKSMMLSMLLGTVAYMILVQVVF